MTYLMIFIASMVILTIITKKLFLLSEKKKIEKRFYDLVWRSENWYIEKN